MIKKLRIKFVAINMAIVLLMLTLLFCMVFHITRMNLENESLRMMRGIAATTALQLRPDDIPDDVRLPFFTVRLGGQGEILATGGGYFDLSDREFLESVVRQVLSSDSRTGILREYNLRYCRCGDTGSQVLVFADTTSEESTLDSLLKTCLLIGLGSLLAFLPVSMLLSKWAAGPIEQAWKQQKQFVADASHELKTPLTVITTNAELLQPESSRNRQAAEAILTTSRQMRKLLEGMLELARSDSEQLDCPLKPLDFSTLVSDEAMSFEAVLFEKGFPLEYRIEEGLQVSGVDSQLRELVGILLDNAGKYTGPGGTVTLTLRSAGKRACLLAVANDGAPIAPEDLRNLFKRFYRADTARSRTGSYGLGLAIAQNIVSRHRGSIRAQSREGVNTFLVELPIR